MFDLRTTLLMEIDKLLSTCSEKQREFDELIAKAKQRSEEAHAMCSKVKMFVKVLPFDILIGYEQKATQALKESISLSEVATQKAVEIEQLSEEAAAKTERLKQLPVPIN